MYPLNIIREFLHHHLPELSRELNYQEFFTQLMYLYPSNERLKSVLSIEQIDGDVFHLDVSSLNTKVKYQQDGDGFVSVYVIDKVRPKEASYQIRDKPLSNKELFLYMKKLFNGERLDIKSEPSSIWLRLTHVKEDNLIQTLNLLYDLSENWTTSSIFEGLPILIVEDINIITSSYKGGKSHRQVTIYFEELQSLITMIGYTDPTSWDRGFEYWFPSIPQVDILPTFGEY